MPYRTKAVLGAVLLAMIAAACGTESGDAGSGDAEPTTVTVYSGREKDLVAPLFADFEAANPSIKLSVRYGDSAELAAQIAEEGGNSPADVFFAQDAGALGAISDKLAALSPSILDSVPDAFRSDAKKWVGVSGRARVVVYNTEAVKPADLPASIEGFTDPKWKGKIGWAPTNGSFQAFVTGLRVLKGDEAARAWLRGIKANDPVVYPKNTPIVEAVGKGEIQAGFVNHYYLLRLKKEQPDLKAANHFLKGGDPGALVNVAGAGILDTAKNKDAASTFVKFLLSNDAQTYFAHETFEYPLATGVDASADLPALSSLEPPSLDLSKLADLEATLAMLRDEGIL